jgi:hypothetical protein
MSLVSVPVGTSLPGNCRLRRRGPVQSCCNTQALAHHSRQTFPTARSGNSRHTRPFRCKSLTDSQRSTAIPKQTPFRFQAGKTRFRCPVVKHFAMATPQTVDNGSFRSRQTRGAPKWALQMPCTLALVLQSAPGYSQAAVGAGQSATATRSQTALRRTTTKCNTRPTAIRINRHKQRREKLRSKKVDSTVSCGVVLRRPRMCAST